MASNSAVNCRLCRAPLDDPRRTLCDICDEYAQHVALQANQRLDKVVGELQNGASFVAASRNAH